MGRNLVKYSSIDKRLHFTDSHCFQACFCLTACCHCVLRAGGCECSLQVCGSGRRESFCTESCSSVPGALSSVERISAVHCPGQDQSVSSTGLSLAGWTPFPAGSETKVAVLTHSAALTIFSNPQIA